MVMMIFIEVRSIHQVVVDLERRVKIQKRNLNVNDIKQLDRPSDSITMLSLEDKEEGGMEGKC
jgi:hypothetical protein